jgi:hypothetical protein
MTIDRRLLAGAAGLAILLAACGGSAASPAATAGAPATAAPASAAPATDAPATDAPATEEVTEEATDEGGINLPPGGMNDLANALPAEINGVAYQRAGFNGDQLGMYGAMAGLDDSTLTPVLEEHGKTVNDVNFAISTPGDGSSTGMIYALQIEGVDATEWMATMNMDPADFETRQIGGKSVYAQGAGGFNVYAYPKGDTLFILLLGNDEIAEGLFSQLP